MYFVLHNQRKKNCLLQNFLSSLILYLNYPYFFYQVSKRFKCRQVLVKRLKNYLFTSFASFVVAKYSSEKLLTIKCYSLHKYIYLPLCYPVKVFFGVCLRHIFWFYLFQDFREYFCSCTFKSQKVQLLYKRLLKQLRN